MCMSNKMVFGYSFINATQLFISYYSKLTHTPMHQPNNPSLNIKISYRYHKTTNKPINKYSSVGPISYSKDINQINKLRRTYTPHKITNKQIPSSLQSEFNLCSSKNVFVFARKSSSPAINPSHFVPTKDNYYSREMTEQVFCFNPRAQQIYYRSMVRSSHSRRQKMGQQIQKRPNTQQHSKTVRLNPEPWQLKGDGHDLESLF